jgi:hypothetical protein
MAKKNELVKNTKAKKRTVTADAKRVLQSKKTQATTSRKTAAAPKKAAPASKKPLPAKKNKYTVFGTVKYTDGTPATGLSVNAYDKDESGTDTLGQPVVTTATGSFSIPYSEADFRKTKKEIGGADVIVCVYNDKQELLFTSKKKNNAPAKYELNITVPAEQFVVRGNVTDSNQKPLAKMRVRAFDRDLRTEELLGNALTDAKGAYAISYTSAQFKRAEKDSADLRVHVFAADGKNELAVSDTLFNAPADAVIDFVIDVAVLNTDTEWERYLREISPLVEKLQLHELTDEDQQFLASETGIDILHLRLMRLDAQWRKQQAKHKLPTSAFYGLLRQGLAQEWASLLQVGPERWRAALKQAIADRQVPAALVGSVDAFVSKLTILAIDQSFVPPPEGSNARMPVGVLLAASTVKLDVQRQIAGLMLDHSLNGDPQQLWQLLAEASVPADAVRSTRFALEAHELINQHLTTLVVLQKSFALSFGAGADLAQLSRVQWLQVAQTVASGGTGSLPKDFDSAEGYADYLADTIELSFPTAVVAHRLMEDAEPARRDVGMFLVLNPDFDLLTTPVEAFLKTAKFGQSKTAPEALKKQLGKEVRVAKIAPAKNRALHMQTLLANGFDSAAKVVMAGRLEFKRRMQMTSGPSFDTSPKLAKAGGMPKGHPVPDVAGAIVTGIFNIAETRVQDSIIHFSLIRDTIDSASPMFPAVTIEPGSDLATWADMFGSANGCYCPQCESVHGPAAYLMDLFEFLKGMEARLDVAPRYSPSLLAILFARRPDLKYLKLNCANAETPLPYIDLVNELLERLIAPVDVATAANTPQTPEEPGSAKDVAARLRALPDENNTRLALYTAGGALQTARYPWNLPFDRSFLQAGIYFGLIGTTPAEVLALTAAPGVDLHRARLGLSHALWTQLQRPVTSDSTEVAASWGLPGTSGLNTLINIGGEEGLLAHSGLAVEELFALIDSPLFAGWTLYVDRRPTPEADPCNIEDAQLRQRIGTGASTPLAADTQVAVFDLMQRTLRLRLALNWSIDKLLTALHTLEVGMARPTIDLIALSRLMSLASRLAVSMERMSAVLYSLDHVVDTRHARADWLALLKLTEDEHSYLVELGLADTIAPQEPAQRLERLEAALETISLLRAANLDPAELRYLLRHKDLVPAVFMPSEETLASQLSTLVTAIRGATAALPALPPDATPAALTERRDEATRLSKPVIEEHLRVIANASFVSWVIADTQVSDPAALVSALLSAQVASAGGVLQDFIKIATEAPSIEEAVADARLAEALLRVQKVCRLLTVLRFTDTDVRALSQLQTAGRRLYDFSSLPVIAVEEGPDLNGLNGLVQACVTQNAMPKADLRLLQIIVSSSASAADLESITGWGRSITQRENGADALQTLALSMGLTGAAIWQEPETYARLQLAVKWLQQRRLMIAPDNALQTLVEAASSTMLSAMSLNALQTLARQRFSTEADWYKALTPAMDRLRTQQRDALLAHILHTNRQTPRWKTADDVYAHLLIDVQMGPCQLSSRIVQAHSAVQLFVQRCLMNLEKPEEVSLGSVSDIAEWGQWAWMKNYRVWEAGRKVFLYPENWIEPDLRDVKSSFFEDLENELLQDEITPDTAERAVRGYLSKLHEVARLDIRALYEETILDRSGDGKPVESKIIHMVGRTHAVPHMHFYRQRLADLTWTPWEKIELSIDADHLVLVVHNQRPMLFWPQFKEVQVEGSDSLRKKWEISLSWSVREQGGWQAPLSSSNTILTRVFDPRIERHIFVLRPEQREQELIIHLLWPFAGVSRSQLPAIYGQFRFDACKGEMTSTTVATEWKLALPFGFVLFNNKLQNNLADRPLLKLYIQTRFPSSEPLGFYHQGFEYGVLRENIVLGTVPTIFTMLPTHQYLQFALFQPFVFADRERQFLALRERTPEHPRPQYRFSTLYHPYTCVMLKALHEEGLAGLYRSPDGSTIEYTGSSPDRFPRQLMRETLLEIGGELKTVFEDRYAPTSLVWKDEAMRPYVYPNEEFDFSYGGAYSLYNWEVFFHIPLLMADRLSKNGRFEEAQQWFHTIFDPTDVSHHSAPKKYWRVLPLFIKAHRWSDPEAIETLEEMMRLLSVGDDDVKAQVEAWRNDPFNPHLLARMRLVAYMKTVVQKYIENLTAWADSLFRRDTMESINEATQLYVLGSHILGEVPVVMPALPREARSYAELTSAGTVDDFANVLIDIDTSLPLSAATLGTSERTAPGVSMLYFCIPGNPRLQELRTAINDRLFKIRNCMNHDGRTRQLALFAPPIDPALLVRARATGLDIGTVLSMALDVRSSHYRFQPMLQKALEFCNEVRSFGGALLSALEKRDGEQLAQLRARHEVSTLKYISLIKRRQVEEADASLEATRKSRYSAEKRYEFYTTREYRNLAEIGQVDNLRTAHNYENISQFIKSAAPLLYSIPNLTIGLGKADTTFGGTHLGSAVNASADVIGIFAAQASYSASMSSLTGGYERRRDDWELQAELATQELAQIDQQIIAAEIRLAMAEQEQSNHEQQIAQSEEAQAALRDKFTNAQLYSWMSAQLAALHYQSYQMAFGLAKQAEAAAHLELETGTTFIQLDNWDGGKKGLLAGERLAQDLRHLELAYMQRNTRTLEITSNISLRRLEPGALWAMRTLGKCTFTLPTWLFDMDFPGQQRRRIKSVSLTMPSVVGPYVGINGILQCKPTGEPPRIIATSSGQNDAGVFQLDFRDERYLPFEGVSLDVDTSWEFALPAVLRPFDYDTISDVVLHVQYTARASDTEITEVDRVRIVSAVSPLQLLISIRHDFPDVTRQLREGGPPVSVPLEDRLFPYFARNRAIPISFCRLQPNGTVPDPTPFGDETDLVLTTEDADAYFIVRYALMTG